MSKWTPQDDNTALTLAAIRWYAISIEKLATDLYITDPGSYGEAKAVLSQAYAELMKLRVGLNQRTALKAGDEDGCPPGYVNCAGVCLPDCDPMGEQY